MDGFHLARSAGQTPASPDGEDVQNDSSRKKEQRRESLVHIGPGLNWRSFTGRHSGSQNSGFHFVPRAKSVVSLCVRMKEKLAHTQSIIYPISHKAHKAKCFWQPLLY